ncbi:MAG: polyphosphate polymerase domain-containing protein [Erysipelotrichaceae bacterium]|nr:polyphosphate polymerase domain-containing protein [Erysipelotrichaceae bacterium]
MENQYIFERTEMKYVISTEQKEQLLTRLREQLIPDFYPHSDIASIYLDSDDFRLIRNAGGSRDYKEKMRIRCYGAVSDDTPVFMELKKKYKGTTYKRRIDLTYRQMRNYLLFDRKPDNSQITNEIDYLLTSCDLKPKVLIRYQRDSFQSRDDANLRITFDYQLRYSTTDMTLTNRQPEDILLSDDKCIMEIKSLAAMPLWLTAALKEMKIYPGSFSKYGTVYATKLAQGGKFACHSYSRQYIPNLTSPHTYYAH